jgi:hypothetical protein
VPRFVSDTALKSVQIAIYWNTTLSIFSFKCQKFS